MDPNATLKAIDALGDEVNDYCQYLFDWLAKGGFEPNWIQYPAGTNYYRRREAIMRRASRVSIGNVHK